MRDSGRDALQRIRCRHFHTDPRIALERVPTKASVVACLHRFADRAGARPYQGVCGRMFAQVRGSRWSASLPRRLWSHVCTDSRIALERVPTKASVVACLHRFADRAGARPYQGVCGRMFAQIRGSRWSASLPRRLWSHVCTDSRIALERVPTKASVVACLHRFADRAGARPYQGVCGRMFAQIRGSRWSASLPRRLWSHVCTDSRIALERVPTKASVVACLHRFADRAGARPYQGVCGRMFAQVRGSRWSASLPRRLWSHVCTGSRIALERVPTKASVVACLHRFADRAGARPYQGVCGPESFSFATILRALWLVRFFGLHPFFENEEVLSRSDWREFLAKHGVNLTPSRRDHLHLHLH